MDSAPGEGTVPGSSPPEIQIICQPGKAQKLFVGRLNDTQISEHVRRPVRERPQKFSSIHNERGEPTIERIDRNFLSPSLAGKMNGRLIPVEGKS